MVHACGRALVNTPKTPHTVLLRAAPAADNDGGGDHAGEQTQKATLTSMPSAHLLSARKPALLTTNNGRLENISSRPRHTADR